MSRLSREKKREQNRTGRPNAVVAPLDVHVRTGGPATIGGVPVAAADGEEIQHAVLGHLHRIALATGHPVLATVNDERIGYVVPLRIETDGSSHFTAEPLRAPAVSSAQLTSAAQVAPAAPTVALPVLGTPKAPAAPETPVNPSPKAPATAPEEPRHDKPTHVLRQVRAPEEPQDAIPLPLPPLPQEPIATPAPTPGTVVAPTGVFGPPPAMDPHPEPGAPAAPEHAPEHAPSPFPEHAVQPAARDRAPEPAPQPSPLPFPEPALNTPEPGRKPLLTPAAVLDPDPKPTPARGFDAVAEAVLGDDPRTLPGADGAPALLGEPMAQINEAVRAGRIDVAAGLAERTVLEASGTLGPEHPEVLRLRELGAYIAYLAGDPLRAFHVSLDLARIHHRAQDGEAAYGNVQSAAAAWRAVRDPLQGLNLGTELLGLWTELTTEEGPAADDVDQLESARARMLRLAERARKSGAQGL
ncbi:tetratricopeptide repeat protein [Streptomyces sp. NPDC005820]|uniref:tetratricopeptide repeat protein n=1 Tax=Streptomyces sp. NPDC005820 TaxID=3157069 RepID=UPI0033D9004B